MTTKIIAIVGKSNSGKTTLLEKLIAHLTQRGYKIGTVKHAHDGFEMDKEGKDSWRHRQAGAKATLVITKTKVAMVKDDNTEDIEKMSAYLWDMDIILAEGFKRQDLPKIEIFRTQSSHKNPLCMADENLIAFVTDSNHMPDVPVFGLEDIKGLSDFIEQNFLKS
ncbi:MAG: molybdopterin-guanine dinucleotide biosynthesis protein B [Proteobacteria bacterium]|nr:molybdopterin-guanine dinucleotide biosynthesis protein B [Pseudomonadota bacterium]MBU1584727.1 molybdopterin-guanine dinucleotide biosynthesis protein B [Pseudomonadota bacterium]MBU2452574.1 molybdopterin-guanine dinucleotide biosynthesis protein B [Pseudomonadota bacterium]MBU2629653.1 molybdopterin-guanine dinucleotide biosynthesis protein B [Pseudomonadota bacterium]